jgi:hypothetical protein
MFFEKRVSSQDNRYISACRECQGMNVGPFVQTRARECRECEGEAWHSNLHVQVTEVLMKRGNMELEEVLEGSKVTDEDGVR